MASHRDKVLVSACLLGRECRYDGRASLDEGLVGELADAEAIPVCPEEMGGLGTPREPAEIEGGDGADVLAGRARVIDRTGRDVTEAFIRGAREAVRGGVRAGAKVAYLKRGSPSCGPDGISSCGRPREGRGIFAVLCEEGGLRVVSRQGARG